MLLFDVLRDVCAGIGFKNAHTPENGLNIPMSIFLGILVTLGMSMINYFFMPDAVIWAGVVLLILSYFSFHWTNIFLIILFSITAVFGIGLSIYYFIYGY